MDDHSTSPQESGRYHGYDRIMGSISWLLIALVSLNIKLIPADDSAVFFLTLLCLLLFFYNAAMRYVVFKGLANQFKTFADLMVFLCFIVAVSWFTGKTFSPFLSLMFLVLMATSLTQGKRITYFMSGLAVAAYILLAVDDATDLFTSRVSFARHLLELFPFMLISHLGAMLAGEAETARLEVERLSLTDEVTGIHNMRNFFNLAEMQEKLAKRHGKHFAVCMIDADNLKKINDGNGHFAGTTLIRHVASIISANIRSSDIAARYGGDEFVILFNETTKEDVQVAVERIIAAARDGYEFEGKTLISTLSAGLASYPTDGGDLRTVMAKADEAMYHSKKTGKNRLTLYSSVM